MLISVTLQDQTSSTALIETDVVILLAGASS